MADDSQRMNQDEIERLLQQNQLKKSAPTPDQPPPPEPAPAAPAGDSALDQAEIEALLSNARQQPAKAESPARASGAVAQGEIESLLSGARGATEAPKAPPPAAPKAQSVATESQLAQGDVEFLLNQAQEALASIDAPVADDDVPAMPFQLREFTGAPPSGERTTLELLRDVDLDLKIELGRTHMYLEDVLKLRKGAVVPLDKLAGDPVDIYVNGRLIARGEVLVLNDNFCVRVAELITGEAVKAG